MIQLVNDLPADAPTTEHTATLTGHGTSDVLIVRFAVARPAGAPPVVRVRGYAVAHAGGEAQSVSLAAIHEYGLDVGHVREAIAVALTV